MGSITRRRIVQGLGASVLLPWLSGCAQPMRSTSSSAPLELLYIADTLDARQPSLPVVPRTRLGPATHIGQAPWMTGSSARLASGASADMIALLDNTHPAQETGGYAVLGGLLTQMTAQAGVDNSLILENGQCWNGSGLAYLSQGGSGVQGSQLLGSDVRVSSDERSLWPAQAASLYRQAGIPVLGAGLSEAQQQRLGTQGVAFFERAGVRIGVVGVINPYARDQEAPLSQWLERLQAPLNQAREQSDLVVVLADVGTGPSFWLAKQLPQADLVLGARGQDLWPQPIGVRQSSGREIPLILAGSRASGVQRIRCQRVEGRWEIQAQFQPAFAQGLNTQGQERAVHLKSLLQTQRAPHASWLDQALGHAPQDLWRRDIRAGTWDQLIYQALADNYSGQVLLPGLRYDYPLKRGQAITREHLLSLTGSYAAPVVEAPASALEQVLEHSAEQLFGRTLLLDNSQDLPRLLGQDWQVAYSPSGKRISGLASSTSMCRTLGMNQSEQEGRPLWQYMEAFLRAQPVGWQMPEPKLPHLLYVQGHPGWHPREPA
ncbi:2',3'-cyclic-nucleotide 2'-phosphodiesterase (5'-nucleotidase family) [Azomonas agilis]|uniref:2',3'-cyclic-nucleotide 2'-phosphodiesterase (5'-nucleotidase family) n=1 Tax=Azomonas agilis TaxID=116849 RepID=A0A562IKH3_9GAMM|nr:2',3'-cyclic-nucleotide 2'-phosphodiesterase (5'-nucleotidase family) [Azomonas agilis]